MNNEINEQVSALMDGELPVEEIEAVLQAFNTEERVRRTWASYHLVHDSLQGHLPAVPVCNLVSQVSRALENEPSLSIAQHPVIDITQRLQHKWKYATGLALAASLSAITVLGIQALTSDPTLSESPLIATSPASLVPNVVPVAGNNTRQWARLKPEVEKRLSSYLANHSEYIDMPGMIRYGRIVSYENPH